MWRYITGLTGKSILKSDQDRIEIINPPDAKKVGNKLEIRLGQD